MAKLKKQSSGAAATLGGKAPAAINANRPAKPAPNSGAGAAPAGKGQRVAAAAQSSSSLVLKLAPVACLLAVLIVLFVAKPSPGGRDGSSAGVSSVDLTETGLFEPDAWPHLPREFVLKPILDAKDFPTSRSAPADKAGKASTAEDTCVDAHEMCPGWAGRGECEANPNYMLVSCQLSCGICKPATAAASDTDMYRAVLRTGEPNTIPRMDGDAVLCQLQSQIHRLEPTSRLIPLAQVILGSAPRRDAVFVMRNGRSEGVWVSWPEPLDGVPEDAFVDPWRGCLHHLFRTAAPVLGVPSRLWDHLDIQVVTDTGLVVPGAGDVRRGMLLHLVLPYELFQWSGVQPGFKRLMRDWTSSPGIRDHGPVIMETLSLEPKIFHLRGMLSEEEADEVVKAGAKGLQRSGLGLKGGEHNEQRTSSSSSIPGSPISMTFRWRAFDMLRMRYHAPLQDGFQLVRYEVGQFFRQHTDYFGRNPPSRRNDSDAERWADVRYKNLIDRYATFFLYLNDVPSGGETVFPLAEPPSAEVLARKDGNHFGMAECAKGLAVRPKKAEAVLFYDMLPEQELDPLSLHGGCPPDHGAQKNGANFWVWNNDRFVKQNADARDAHKYS